MISAWMLYALGVAALSAAAAWILELLLRSHRFPTRWIWAGAMGLGTLWPLWTALKPDTTDPGVPLPIPSPILSLEALTLQVTSTSIWQTLDTPLVTVWVLATGGLLAFALNLLRRTRRLRRGFATGEAGGRSVLLSENWGPAVVGLLDPRIVLPRWCQSIEEEELGLILEHEVEHLKAGDLRLMVLTGIAPVVFPWSLPLWWTWHRLSLAVEGDCDLRVLQKNPRATRAYLELLLEVGRRLPHGRMAAALLSEPERTLERRIRIMTMPIPKKPFMRGAILVGAGIALIAAACLAPTPTAVAEEAELSPTATALSETPGPDQEATVPGEPTFTPFTVRPDIKNREEVARALEENYPPELRSAGIGGTVTVWVYVDVAGVVKAARIQKSSGQQALDQAALSLARGIEFTAAENDGDPVAVWIALPITFSTR